MKKRLVLNLDVCNEIWRRRKFLYLSENEGPCQTDKQLKITTVPASVIVSIGNIKFSCVSISGNQE